LASIADVNGVDNDGEISSRGRPECADADTLVTLSAT